MKRKAFLLLSTLLLTLGAAVSCGGNEGTTSSQEATSYQEGYYTSQLKLTRDFTGKNFIDDGIGEVTFASATDGDTAKFFCYNSQLGVEERIAIRFLGVNTPESTAKVEPWGKSASVYTSNIVSTATSIVLENDIDVWGQKDNNGYRYLGFVWYKLQGDTEYKNLNLELIELGYSRNQLFDDSSLCPYRSTFESADLSARNAGIRVHGQVDPNYDYSNEVKEVTIAECRNNYDEYGMQGAASGSQLRVEALVVGMIGDNMVLRDLVEDEETGLYPGMYAYLGYNTSLASAVGPGDIVRFYCRLTTFNGNMQFTDVKSSFIGDKKFQILEKGLTGPTEAYPAISMEPYYIDPSDINRSADLADYAGGFIQTEVTIREINPSDYSDEEGTDYIYYRKDNNNNMTVYAKINDALSYTVPCNLRVDGLSSPYPSHTLFEVGAKYRVMGYLAPYFENFQIQLFNNTSSNYIVKI